MANETRERVETRSAGRGVDVGRDESSADRQAPLWAVAGCVGVGAVVLVLSFLL